MTSVKNTNKPFFLLSGNKDVEQRVWWDCDEERYQGRWTVQHQCRNILGTFQVGKGLCLLKEACAGPSPWIKCLLEVYVYSKGSNTYSDKAIQC